MARMYDRPTLGPDGWIIDETPTPNPVYVEAQTDPVTGGMVGIQAGANIYRVPYILTPLSTQKVIHGLASATYSQTGTAVTVTCASHGMTALLNGSQIYLVQSTGALLSGWFTALTYIDANSFSCTSSVSQSTSGNLGTNTAETTMWSTTLDAGRLQLDSRVRTEFLFQSNATANNKTISAKLGAYVYFTNTVSSAAITGHAQSCGFANMGSLSKQGNLTINYTSGFGGTTLLPAVGTIDTSASQTLTITMQLANTGDFLALWTGRHMIEP